MNRPSREGVYRELTYLDQLVLANRKLVKGCTAV